MANGKRTYLTLFLFVFVVSLFFSGGRLASSDELSFYLVAESIVLRGELSIDPSLVQNGAYGPDGKFYSGAGIGQPLLTIPFYLVGHGVVNLFKIEEPLRTFVVRGSVSLMNQIVAGLIAVVMVAFGRQLGYSLRTAVFLALGLIFTTNVFPYVKSFMRDPQLLLYLLTAAYLLYMYRSQGGMRYVTFAAALCGLGLLTRVTFSINIPLLLGYLIILHLGRSPLRPNFVRAVAAFCWPIALALAANALYNFIQFGSVLATSYDSQGFTTPLFVGVYGLLFSSGKSYFLYAPLAILVFIAISPFAQRHRAESYLFAGIFFVNLVFFGKWVAWAGDGSWGPRYLLATLPFLILPLGVVLESRVAVRRVGLVLATLGLFIQLGGVSIYLGNYMREIGEFPYTRTFDDPEFLYRSHFIPNYSPVFGHWKMLVRNAGMHLAGEIPTLDIGDPEERIPLSEDSRRHLLFTLDFWFTYMLYAGIRSVIIIPLVVLLAVASVWFGIGVVRVCTPLSQTSGRTPL